MKKIKFDLDDDEQAVKDKVTSDAKEDEAEIVVGFPQLRSCGGFEMMQCLPNCRDHQLILVSKQSQVFFGWRAS